MSDVKWGSKACWVNTRACTLTDMLHVVWAAKSKIFKQLPHDLKALTCQSIIPQHGPRRRRRLVQLFVAFGLACHLFVNVACSHSHPQSGSQSWVVQQDADLEENAPLNAWNLLKGEKCKKCPHLNHKNAPVVKGSYRCYYLLLSFGNIGHTVYIFSQNSFVCEILCLFTFRPYSINVTESA